MIEVEDDGPGIPARRRAELLDDRAETGAWPGVGLGLTIVRGVVNAHGGHLTLDEGCAGGLRVVIRLPGPLPPQATPSTRARAAAR